MICKEISPLITDNWQSINLTILVAIKDLSTSYEGTYIDEKGIVKYLPGYGDNGWDLHLLIGEWYKSDHELLKPQHRWNKIQFEINQEGYAAVTTWDQEYYAKVYPYG